MKHADQSAFDGGDIDKMDRDFASDPLQTSANIAILQPYVDFDLYQGWISSI